MATAIGHKLPSQFLFANRERRIIDGVALAINKGGYIGTHITDMVRAARVARKTFYETFSSKEAVARALVADVSPSAERRLNSENLERCGVSILAVELAAARLAGDTDRADRVVSEVRDTLPVLPEASLEVAQEDLCALVGGRHGLPREFVSGNQRNRLLVATADAICAQGYRPSTIRDVTARARVSRRTFYEHFKSMREAAQALVAETSPAGSDLLGSSASESGLEALKVEVVAVAVRDEGDAAECLVAEAMQTLDLLCETSGVIA